MNQIISFMKKLISKVLEGSKDLTTRIATEYRQKLNIGDIAYIYTGMRTSYATKHAEAEIINRWVWNQSDLSKTFIMTMFGDWEDFYKREGFESWEELITYFTQTRYKDKMLITYQFKINRNLDEWVKK